MNKRYALLDILRFSLAIWVAIYHLSGGHGWFKYLKHPYGNLIEEGKLGLFSSVISLGYVAVPIFFVLSGFVIVVSSKNRTGSQFIAARISRLFPGFLLSFVLALLVYRFGFDGIVSIRFNNMLSTLNGSWSSFQDTPIVGSYWTLWVEARFYLLFLILLLFKNINYKKRVLIFFSCWLISEYFVVARDSALSQFLISEYAMFFILGGLLGLLLLMEEKFMLYFLLASALIFSVYRLRLWIFEWSPTDPTLWRLGVFLFMISILVINLSSRIDMKNGKISQMISVMGRSSYIIYLLQESLGMPLTSYLVVNGLQIRFAIVYSLLIITLISIIFCAKLETIIIDSLRNKILLNFNEVRG